MGRYKYEPPWLYLNQEGGAMRIWIPKVDVEEVTSVLIAEVIRKEGTSSDS